MINIFDSQTADDVPFGLLVLMALWSCRDGPGVFRGRCTEIIFSLHAVHSAMQPFLKG